MIRETAVFVGLWLQKPLHIAAICPSSQHLAAAVVALADFDRPGRVLELGAGTGGLTRGLLEAGCPIERLVALEAEPRMVAVLRRKFPGIETIVGDVRRLDRHLRDRGIDRLAVVVSSLPIKWFAITDQRAVVAPCFERLGPGGRFLQITNAFSSPLSRNAVGTRGREAVRVWRNLPPAQVWVYSA
jgi:phosphatidylethanolamine/phosphatidyl-N-methylethanolamine N-methyltransferase